MTPEWITTGATIFTAFVIAASAAAALIQIRHMRKGNEIELMQKWTEAIESPEFERARFFVLNDLPRMLSDPHRMRSLSWDNTLPTELISMRAVCNHFESVGAFIKLGSVDRRVACELWAFVVLECWRSVAPVAALVRKRTGRDAIWENFEYLAALSMRHIASHPEGTYPPDVSRMPVDTSLIDLLEAPKANG
jgi:hypothetical protein